MSDTIKHAGCYPVILAASLPASCEFYQRLAGFHSVWANDWFALLQSPDESSVQLAFVRPDHDSIPEAFQGGAAQGVIITIEVADAVEVHHRATAAGIPILRELTDEAWGQRHFMVTDPDGLLVDVVQELFVVDPATV